MYQCRLCDKQFEQPQTLALHEKHHQYKFQCGYCSRKMKTEREFLRHEATHAESTPVTHVTKPRQTKTIKSNKVVQECAKPDPSNQSEPNQESRPISQQSMTSKIESRPNSQQSINSSQGRRHQSRQRQSSSQDDRPPSQNSRASSQQSMSMIKSPSFGDNKTNEMQSNEAEVFKKAALYDEIQKRCFNMEREIESLKTKYDLSDSDEDDDKKNLVKVEHLGREELNDDITQKDDAYEISDSELTSSNMDDDNTAWDDNDKTVPKNWKVTNAQDGSRWKKIFKSPEGFVFQTRVKALEFMINGNYPEPLLSLMKNNLGDEGWIHDRSCPVQWKTRKFLGLGEDVDFEYLSPRMDVIPSMQEMLNMVQNNEDFDFKDVKNLEDKIASLKAKKRKKFDCEVDAPMKTDIAASEIINEFKRREFAQEGDEVLPAGWSKKKIGESKVYVSPEGDIVHTIQQVLANLEQNENSEALKQDTKEELKPTTAEKRKFEELFTMNKKGKLNHSPKVKQKSSSFSVEQVKILEGIYVKSLYPSDQNIKDICNSTNLTEREVKKWFVKRGAEQARGLMKSKNKNSANRDLGTKQDKPSSTSGLVDPHLSSNLPEQHISALNEIFKSKPYPTAENFKQISDRLGLERQLVIQWFRKRRAEKTTPVKRATTKSPLTNSADQNNMITAEQERSLQEILAKTKNPTHQDYKTLVISTGLSRLKIERWFNFQK